MLIRATIVCFFIALLSGCLRVEVVGPVVGANVSITKIDSGVVVASGLETSDVESSSTQFDGFWEEWNDLIRLLFIGNVQIPESEYEQDAFYLITVTGGADIDANGDGIIDSTGTDLATDLHAIVTGEQLALPLLRVNLMTEAVYQALQADLSTLTKEALSDELGELSEKLIGETKDGTTPTYEDVLAYSPSAKLPSYAGPEIFAQRLRRSVHDPFYGPEILSFDAQQFITSANWKAAKDSSPFAETIFGCVGAVLVEDLCTFNAFPMLGQQPGVPSFSEIMDRVVVSHPWMAARFEQLLPLMPEDIRLLFRSATAVVIDADIRPSYYQPAFGAIFLDPGFLWLNQSELDSISSEPDFRSEFTSLVSFADLWRYVDPVRRRLGARAFADLNGNRDAGEVAEQTASLLFHELAHAADYFRPATLNTLPGSGTPFGTILTTVSDELVAEYPLTSFELFGVADVLFAGTSPTPLQANYQGADIGAFFENDIASDLYNYFTQFEDAAMLFEEAMMAIHYDLRRDKAFTSVPSENTFNVDCEDFVVQWGVRGRIADPAVLPRAKLVIEEILPEREYNAALNNLPAPQSLDNGKDWCNSAIIDFNSPAIPQPSTIPRWQFSAQRPYR